MSEILRYLTCAGFVLGWAHSMAIGQVMLIDSIHGIDTPTSEVPIPSDEFPTFLVDWDMEVALGLCEVYVYVDNQQVECVGDCGPGFIPPSTTCGAGHPSGTVIVAQTDFTGMHTIQLVGNIGSAPGNPPRIDSSESYTFWSTPYSEDPGPEDCNKSTVGRPIDVATGKMYHERTDLVVQGPLPITLYRRYDSQSTFDGALGYGWHHAYLMRLEDLGPGRMVFVDRRGRRHFFAQAHNQNQQPVWPGSAIDGLGLVEQATSPEWTVRDRDNMEYEFDATRKLTKLRDRNGNELTFGYNPDGMLTTITDPFQRVVTLDYDINNRLWHAVADTRTITYEYDGDGNLDRVTYPDSSFVTYDYEDTDIHNMTAAADENGNVIEAHIYDNEDRVIHTEAEDQNNALQLLYDDPAVGTTTVLNPLSLPTIYTHDEFSGLVTDSSGSGCTSCGGGGTSHTITYDIHLNPETMVDGRGTTTAFTFVNGNMEERKEAVNTAVERTTSFTYHPDFHLPVTVKADTLGSCNPPGDKKVTTNTYDDVNGNLDEQKVEGCHDAENFTHITTYTYDDYGQIETVDGPRTEPDIDITTHVYYPDTAALNLKGRLNTITNAEGHVTTFSDYDYFGNVGRIVDANDVETEYTYDERDRLTQVRIIGDPTPAADIVTINVYDLAGSLDKVRYPRCVDEGPACEYSLDYTYDGVNRLTMIEDRLEHKIVYAYDSEGNRTRESFKVGIGMDQGFTNFKYDGYNRLEYVYFNATVPEAAGSSFIKYGYDGNGNRTSEQDPEGHLATFDFDELNRLTDVHQTVAGNTLTTHYGYDVQDNLDEITDPLLLVTTYTNSDARWRLETDSPDSGITTDEYDPAGNLLSSTHAGLLSDRTYDNLNRLLTVSYPGNTNLNVGYTYDDPTVSFGIGRRTGMTDPSGSTTYHYDRRGLLSLEEKLISGVQFDTGYDYDKNGNLEQILYPTDDPLVRQGQVDYIYDDADRVSSITAEINGAPTTVGNNLLYQPFGPRTDLTFGNGLMDSRMFDSRYRMKSWTLGSLLNYTHLYDEDNNLEKLTDILESANTRTFDYDEIHRLTDAEGPWGVGTACTDGVTYEYDDNGNRMCKGLSTTTTTYAYTPETNQLASSSGDETATYDYDSRGSITGDGTHTYEYGENGRLLSVDGGSTATYAYDGDGRRVIKTASGVTTYFFYDQSSRLLAEVTPFTAAGKDYVYLDGAPVARVDWSTEEGLGTVLKLDDPASEVGLDWTEYPGQTGDEYIVRRKKVVDPSEKTFDGNEVLVEVDHPSQTHDDAVLADDDDYDYLVLRRSTSETAYYYHTDHLGTPIAMTDSAGGSSWRVEHRPFGDIDSSYDYSPFGIENNLRFPGQYFDAETGLHQNYFRSYDPTIGRYRTPDPNGLRSDANLFVYASGNPAQETDPLGLFPATENPYCAYKLAVMFQNALHNVKWDDKYKHCVVSCILSEVCGLGSAGAAGLGKEFKDVFFPGTPEPDDLVADADGLICSLSGGNVNCTCCCKKKGYSPTGPTPPGRSCGQGAKGSPPAAGPCP